MLQEEGHVTLRMMARPGRIRGVGSIFGVLRNVLPGDTADTVGKIRLLTGQPEGDGAPSWAILLVVLHIVLASYPAVCSPNL